MAHHTHGDLSHELTRMRPAGQKLGPVLMVVGILAVLVAFFAAPTGQRFWFAYLFGLAAITAVSCSALIIMIVNHLVRTGWITNVRRIIETFALQTGLVLILVLPIVVLALAKNGTVYSWAKPGDTPIVHHGEHAEPGHADASHAGHDHATGEPHAADAHAGHDHGPASATAPTTAPATTAAAGHDGHDHAHDAAHAAKPGDAHGAHDAHAAPAGQYPSVTAYEYPNHQVQPGVARAFDHNIHRKNHTWLNPWFWSFRVIAYLSILFGVAYYFWSNSVKQDVTGDIDINARLSYQAGPLLAACGLITTFVAFDVFMSLDPHWFSTMFGVYFFASGTQAMWALTCLFVLVLQSRGYLRESITQEHRHDLGKFLWAFIFFFGYIAFSQYMLQWYANLPEETFWFDKRGYSEAHPNGYTVLVVALLIGRFIVPFLGLISRHVKRNRFGLGFWAAWLLCFFVIDMYLLVMPEQSYTPPFGATEIFAFAGIVLLWFGNVIRVLGNHQLRPVRDPRVHESVALQNF